MNSSNPLQMLMAMGQRQAANPMQQMMAMGSQQHQPIDPQRFTAAASKLDKQFESIFKNRKNLNGKRIHAETHTKKYVL